MTSLETLDAYRSGRLHWFPYEITRCPALVDSRMSTRLLYGNIKLRTPFPALPTPLPPGSTPGHCSVCAGEFGPAGPIQRWISLRVATDVIPLLVHACTEDCLRALPVPPVNYVDHPHEGGSTLKQPPDHMTAQAARRAEDD